MKSATGSRGKELARQEPIPGELQASLPLERQAVGSRQTVRISARPKCGRWRIQLDARYLYLLEERSRHSGWN